MFFALSAFARGVMTRWQALAIIVVIWAAIFLPGLGSMELKGEEGRRIMPGVEMMERGDWVVPHFHGKPYLRKPPLVNWLIALSIQTVGARNEWTVRLPSALAVLALVTASFFVLSGACGQSIAAIAAIMMMTNLGLIEKGRLAEIEAIYIALFGLGMVMWLGGWMGKKSPWFSWTIPFVFFGLGLLAKGPLHLFFFYAMAVPVLWRARELRQLAHPAHFAGIAIMIGIFALWAVPYFRAVAHLDAAGIWASQMEERLGGGHFDFGGWLRNFPRALGNYLPWIIFLPFLWDARALSTLAERERVLLEGARWPVPGCFFGLMLIPGMLPRYTLPMLAPASVLLAIAIDARFGARAWRWALSAGAAVGLGMCFYAIAIVPRVNATADVRPLGAQVDAAVPAGEPLHVYDPGLAPFLFYVHSPIVYATDLSDLPAGGCTLLVRDRGLARLKKIGREAEVRVAFRDKDGTDFHLVRVAARS